MNPHVQHRTQKTILCVDDEPSIVTLLGVILERAGYRVLTALHGADAIKLFLQETIDAVILDYLMPGINGATVAAQIRKIRNDVPIILLSACLTIPEEDLTLFQRFLSKGVSPAALLAAIEELVS